MRANLFGIVALALLTACKSPTPADEMDSVLSWVGTAGTVGDAWLRHTTPDKYTRQTLELSDQTLLDLGAQLLKSPPPVVDSAMLDSVLTRSRFHVAQMWRLVEEKNAPDFKTQLDSLRLDEKL